jgi:hypothetical protein
MEDSAAATPAQWVAGGLYPSIVPVGTRDTLTQTRTHGSGLVDICGLQRLFGDRGRRPADHQPRHRRRGCTASAYKACL